MKGETGKEGGGRGERGWEVGGKWEVRASMLLPVMNILKTYTVEGGGGAGETDQWRRGSERKNYRENWGGGRRGW